MSAYLEELRAALRENAPPPAEIHGALAFVLITAGEYARATRMPVDEFVSMCVQAWAESNDRKVTQCEVVEEPDASMQPGVDILIGMSIKWTES